MSKKTKGRITKSVFATSDFSQFTVLEENREPDRRALNKLKAAIKRRDILSANPIKVFRWQGKLAIADGQHRYWAAKELTEEGIPTPIYYMVCPEFVVDGDIDWDAIAAINIWIKKWSYPDHTHNHVKRGNAHYEKYSEFQKATGLPYTFCVSLLSGTQHNAGTETLERFREGRFKTTPAAIRRAYRIANIINKVSDLISGRQDRRWPRSRSFALAIAKCCSVPGFDDAVFVKKASRLTGKLEKRGDVPQYIDMINEIYNNHAHAERRMNLPEALKLMASHERRACRAKKAKKKGDA